MSTINSNNSFVLNFKLVDDCFSKTTSHPKVYIKIKIIELLFGAISICQAFLFFFFKYQFCINFFKTCIWLIHYFIQSLNLSHLKVSKLNPQRNYIVLGQINNNRKYQV